MSPRSPATADRRADGMDAWALVLKGGQYAVPSPATGVVRKSRLGMGKRGLVRSGGVGCGGAPLRHAGPRGSGLPDRATADRAGARRAVPRRVRGGLAAVSRAVWRSRPRARAALHRGGAPLPRRADAVPLDRPFGREAPRPDR